MFRSIPCASKICSKKWKEEDQERHERRLKGMKGYIDNEEPTRPTFLLSNRKREIMLEEHYAAIDRENKFLLRRMAEIMRKPTFSAIRSVPGPVSLNREYRKKEVGRITHENHRLLKRLERVRPVYNHREWVQAAVEQERYLNNICEFPVTLGARKPREAVRLPPLKPHHTTVEGGMAQTDGMASHRWVQSEPSSVMKAGMVGGPSAASTQKRAKKKAGEAGPRRVLKEGRKLDGRFYLIEFLVDGRTLTITADSEEAPSPTLPPSLAHLELILDEKTHTKALAESHNSYSAIAKRLAIKSDGTLYLAGTAAAAGAKLKRPAPKSTLLTADQMVRRSFEREGTPDVASRFMFGMAVDDEGAVDVAMRGVTPSTPGSVKSGAA
ncbi:unnamed protein product [Vitrella brassicaformis CCMP3155]|uniref:Uncharacterized protein n=2 Tax=Vitrella brassicaformis TaxID=1169539 RepID=A0A0G4G028_VITBC|nr:unnamed protein product [Vitrella brassicaformis CCMP3155]|eukprot:CEM20867.1 unnamed protein product [Vitrella brassicaformis CCMP3155]